MVELLELPAGFLMTAVWVLGQMRGCRSIWVASSGLEKAGGAGSLKGTAVADFVSIKLVKLTCLCV